MHGYLHVFLLETREAPYERRIPQYQVNFTTAGKSYTRVIEEPKLAEFLREEIALDADSANRALEELHASGQTTVGGLEISEGEAYALGLKQTPSDI
jgi:hypothetical protein